MNYDCRFSYNLTIPIMEIRLIEDSAKDGGEEFFTEMHCVRITDLYRFYRNSIKECSASR